jgi:hypothetical protein
MKLLQLMYCILSCVMVFVCAESVVGIKLLHACMHGDVLLCVTAWPDGRTVLK